jgi:hypothetical protein
LKKKPGLPLVVHEVLARTPAEKKVVGRGGTATVLPLT